MDNIVSILTCLGVITATVLIVMVLRNLDKKEGYDNDPYMECVNFGRNCPKNYVPDKSKENYCTDISGGFESDCSCDGGCASGWTGL